MLGLQPGSSPAAVQEARRELAKRAHPDVGGTVEAMQRLNDAAEAALREVASSGSSGAARPGRRPPSDGADHGRRRRGEAVVGPPGERRDHPSFTVEALPVHTFEGLLVVASWLGELVLDEPPYELEVSLSEPVRGWCRLEIVPDAGSSTVSLAVAAEPGYPAPDIDLVRDVWIDGLNRLDWDDLDRQQGPRRPPS